MFRNLNISAAIPIPIILWAWIGLDLIVSVVIFFFYNDPLPINRFVEASKFFFLVSGAGFVVFMSYCQWKTSLLNLDFLKSNQELEKKKVSLQILGKWDSEQFKENREFYRNTRKKKNNMTNQQLIDDVENNSSHRNSLLDIANFFEDVEQSLTFNIADDQILQHGFKPLVSSIKETYDPWFDMLKSTDAKYYNQFTPFFNLLEKWK